MTKIVVGWVVLCFTVAPALAEQVLYCVDTDAVGFFWNTDTSQARRMPFKVDRYTVKVLSETARIMTRMVGDTAGRQEVYTCKLFAPGRIACDRGDGIEPWLFSGNTYTRAYLAGPPAGGTDKNISI